MRRLVDLDNKLSGSVIAAAIAVHRELGPGLDEPHYEESLSRQLFLAGIRHDVQWPVPLIYKGVNLDCGYRIDLLIDGRLVVEVKSVELVHPVHVAQLLTYLRLSRCELGLLINFDVPVLKDGIQRKVWSHDVASRLDDREPESASFGNVGLSSQLIAAAFEVHRTLGPGLLRSAYEEALCYELSQRKLQFERKKLLPIRHAGIQLEKPCELRLLVEGQLPVECLSVAQVNDLHVSRLLARLRQNDWPEGYVLNFNAPLLGKGGIRRVTK